MATANPTQPIEPTWTHENIFTHPRVKPVKATEDAAIAAHAEHYKAVTEADAESRRLWSEATGGGTIPAMAAASWIAKAGMSKAQEILDRARAAELLSRETMEQAQQATKDAIATVLEGQLARQCRARAVALEAVYDTFDLPIMQTETLRHERAGQPIEGWVGLRTDYAARVRERFGA